MSPEDLMLAGIAAANDGVFSIDHARLCGLTPKQLHFRARFIWVPLHAGVFRMPGAPATWRGAARAACRAGEPNAFMHPNDVQLIDDLPVVRPERAAFELASIYRSADFIERVLHAARRKRLVTYESTAATFERLAGRGRPGVVVFREALERWRPAQRPTESEMETRLLQMLRTRGFPEPVLQYEVFDRAGRFVARVDAALPEYGILIEYDSKQEHSDEWAIARDAARRNRLGALGLQPLVARHRDLVNGGGELAAAIHDCIRRTA